MANTEVAERLLQIRSTSQTVSRKMANTEERKPDVVIKHVGDLKHWAEKLTLLSTVKVSSQKPKNARQLAKYLIMVEFESDLDMKDALS